ncbi:YggS family pyridoxal phosphate-dependent enzyme [Streptacidiphilus sp. PB12-B1b]|uniref:YggS family pyridoxal phosphate-dependent enzyme n=1 Tax=Streptacidiphilus sp. PB12-B1b TaxID=2705012 RepID=UPI0015F97AF5|nr:YggS family pyridoxal phosphate-dependent enzyme [Streptacidiphilus sp. PB12-B1b]QMU75916.1 YggS family pyridoxal phosphate-dependent enzyme [Streptacidiphilus sp. PB12-B1b]
MTDGQNGSGADESARREQLRANLASVEQRIAAACAAAGRSRDEVTLVVVTKTYPASDVKLLSGLGVEDVAENRDQDAAPKAEECSGLNLSWHFVGQLQTNKVRSVLRYADRVHSVDRLRLIEALSAGVLKAEREPLGCLIQVDLGGESGGSGSGAPESASGPGRGGARPADVPDLAAALASAPGLRLDGVMAVAPLRGPMAGRPDLAFARLAEISSRVREVHPAATMVSAGMSGDLEQAIAAGATHVRVGTAVLGARPPLG